VFDAVLVANRGEIACRVIRSAKALGLRAVAVYTDPGAGVPHTALADEAVHLGTPDGYLDIGRILAAAKAGGAGAIHPGYGFLSESAEFARAVTAAGLVFVGPTPEQLELFGDKHTARAAGAEAGDGAGSVVSLGDRDCSVQRRNQKVLEAMKLEVVVRAPVDGVVADVLVTPGQHLTAGQALVVIADRRAA
jgi:acetyl/propionyl-CoA carboxylase alpha subunit